MPMKRVGILFMGKRPQEGALEDVFNVCHTWSSTQA